MNLQKNCKCLKEKKEAGWKVKERDREEEKKKRERERKKGEGGRVGGREGGKARAL